MAENEQTISPAGRMHPASVHLRRILVLNDVMEYRMRMHLKTNDTDFQAMQQLMQLGPLTPSKLAGALHLTTAAITSVIDRLEKAGHAERVPHPTDRRGVLVKPTDSSVREAMAQLMPMILKTDSLVREMDDKEQQAVTRYLQGAADAVQERIDAMAQEHQEQSEETGGPTTAGPTAKAKKTEDGT